MSEDIKPKKDDPLANIVIRDASGKPRPLNEVLAEESADQVEIDVSLLQIDDVVHANYEKDGARQRFSFKLVGSTWSNLGLSNSFSPNKSWLVDLIGLDPHETRPQRARLIGSGWGRSMVSPGVIATQRSLSFGVQNQGRVNSPFISKLVVVRLDRSESGMSQRIVTPDDLVSDNQEIAKTQESRMMQYEALMKEFGFAEKFDFRDGKPYTGDDDFLQYEDEKLAAQYNQGAAMGNTLIIYKKQTGLYACYKYYNFEGKNTLQVSYANLNPKEFQFNRYGSGLFNLGNEVPHVEGAAIITHTTAPKMSLDAINYKATGVHAIDLSAYGLQGSHPLDIQIFSDSSIQIPREYPQAKLEDDHSGIFESIKSSISVKRENNVVALVIGATKHELLVPNEVFRRISE